VHAHTGVKTHLIGPADGRMVARVDRFTPSHASVKVRAVSRVRAGCKRRAGEQSRGNEPRTNDGKEVASSVPIPQLGVGQYR
jgi:hypothetical protein